MIFHFNDKSFHKIDSKGRLLLPKELRTALRLKAGDQLVLVPNLADPAYLEIRTQKQWVAYVEGLKSDGASGAKKDSFRYAMMFKEEGRLDGQGRVTLSDRIRQSCALAGPVAVINMESYIEVWSKEHVTKRYNKLIEAFKETNDRMF